MTCTACIQIFSLWSPPTKESKAICYLRCNQKVQNPLLQSVEMFCNTCRLWSLEDDESGSLQTSVMGRNSRILQLQAMTWMQQCSIRFCGSCRLSVWKCFFFLSKTDMGVGGRVVSCGSFSATARRLPLARRQRRPHMRMCGRGQNSRVNWGRQGRQDGLLLLCAWVHAVSLVPNAQRDSDTDLTEHRKRSYHRTTRSNSARPLAAGLGQLVSTCI